MTPVIPIPATVLQIARRLDEAGHEVWCVGGAVRDNLLHLENNDFDLATSARPEDVQRLFKRTVPVGVEHGTVGVLDEDRVMHEVTTFRRDVQTDGRHAVVEFGASLEDDLARRDFTINAIAIHPFSGEWADPHGGRDDLERGLVRAVGDPRMRFREDYLRIVRALRFAARFGFEIEGPTWEAALAEADGLEGLSAERVREEWMRGLGQAVRPSRLVERWEAVGALALWLPEVTASVPSALDVLDRLRPDPILMTSYLSTDPGVTLERLRCSRADIDRGRNIGRYRDGRPDSLQPPDVRRWLAMVGPACDDLVAIAAAVGDARLVAAIAQVRAASPPLTVADLAVTGADLMEAGIPQGPEVGRILGDLLDLVLANPSQNDRDGLIAAARQWIAGDRAPDGSAGTGRRGDATD